MYIPERDSGNRSSAAVYSVRGVDEGRGRTDYGSSGGRRKAGAADKGCQESTAACGERVFGRMWSVLGV